MKYGIKYCCRLYTKSKCDLLYIQFLAPQQQVLERKEGTILHTLFQCSLDLVALNYNLDISDTDGIFHLGLGLEDLHCKFYKEHIQHIYHLNLDRVFLCYIDSIVYIRNKFRLVQEQVVFLCIDNI